MHKNYAYKCIMNHNSIGMMKVWGESHSKSKNHSQLFFLDDDGAVLVW